MSIRDKGASCKMLVNTQPLQTRMAIGHLRFNLNGAPRICPTECNEV
jgi:hypothetical protein